jgi:hypothetical protein
LFVWLVLVGLLVDWLLVGLLAGLVVLVAELMLLIGLGGSLAGLVGALANLPGGCPDNNRAIASGAIALISPQESKPERISNASDCSPYVKLARLFPYTDSKAPTAFPVELTV